MTKKEKEDNISLVIERVFPLKDTVPLRAGWTAFALKETETSEGTKIEILQKSPPYTGSKEVDRERAEEIIQEAGGVIIPV